MILGSIVAVAVSISKIWLIVQLAIQGLKSEFTSVSLVMLKR
jgi:hypothetical protein